MKSTARRFATVSMALTVTLGGVAHAQTDKPNILVIWGDDVGIDNISVYNLGMMGYRTPHIDRIAREGSLFTDAYAEQTCTAGRSAFVLGEHPFRTGLLTIGMPGSDHGIPNWAPTIGDVLKEQGYATAQFGKNHLGDQDEHRTGSRGPLNPLTRPCLVERLSAQAGREGRSADTLLKWTTLRAAARRGVCPATHVPDRVLREMFRVRGRVLQPRRPSRTLGPV